MRALLPVSSRLAAASLLVLLTGLVACEDPTLPASLDDARYTSLVIEEATLDPAPGTTLTRGQTLNYDVAVRYQREASDMAADESAWIAFYVELWDSTATGWSWISDAAAHEVVVTDEAGSVTFSGSTTIPATGARCETYDQIRFLAIMEPAANVSHRDVVNYRMTGTGTIPSAGSVALGETRADILQASAPCEVWTLTLPSARTVSISLDSDDFDSYLILQSSTGAEITRDDDGGGNFNSLIVQELAAGTYRILVTSYGGDTGGYQLTVNALGAGCDPTGTVAPGGTVNGTLQSGDCQLGDGRFYDVWLTTLSDSSEVTVDLSSSSLDTYLIMVDEDGTVVGENDDAGSTTNSRIEAVLAAGTYRILATSFDVDTGPYTLAVAAVSTGNPVVSIESARQQAAGTEVLVEGVITAGSGTYSAQTFYLQDATGGMAVFLGSGSSTGPFTEGQRVRVGGTIGSFLQEVQIAGAVTVTPLGTATVPAAASVTGNQLNSGQDQGELVRITGAVVESVGAAGTTGNYTVNLRDASGPFVVFVDGDTGIPASTFTVGATYTVTGIASRADAQYQLKPRRAADVVETAAPSPCTTWGTVTVPDTVAGELAATDCTSNGFHHDGYQVTVTVPTTVTIDLMSSFDTYLIVTGTTNSDPGQTTNWIDWDDDSGVDRNSQITMTLQPGSYVVWARSFSPGVTGPYTLSLTVPAPATPCNTWPTLARPSTVSGTIASTDCAPGDGFNYDGYSLNLASSATVTITLTSSQFDAFLVLTNTTNSDPSVGANWLASDSNSGGGTDARLTLSLPAGRYVVWASTHNPGETGSYQLTVQ